MSKKSKRQQIGGTNILGSGHLSSYSYKQYNDIRKRVAILRNRLSKGAGTSGMCTPAQQKPASRGAPDLAVARRIVVRRRRFVEVEVQEGRRSAGGCKVRRRPDQLACAASGDGLLWQRCTGVRSRLGRAVVLWPRTRVLAAGRRLPEVVWRRGSGSMVLCMFRESDDLEVVLDARDLDPAWTWAGERWQGEEARVVAPEILGARCWSQGCDGGCRGLRCYGGLIWRW
jgi:hypothetical protein